VSQDVDAILDSLDEKVADDPALYRELISIRGGCPCHINPPCGACCSPLTMSEAVELGIWPDDFEVQL
jgi:hypothetical protein